jgi:alpha-beta hydrolase superfamily lysophospholipase
MYKRSEGFFKGYQDANLFFQVWEPTRPIKGTMIITHGQGEHSEAYIRLIDAFQDDCWRIYAWDLRGHGRSEGRRGFVADFDDYCRDFKIFIDQVMAMPEVAKNPVVLFCHSMGATVQLKSVIRNPDIKAAAMILSAPLLGVALPVPAYKATAAGVLNSFLPQVTLGNEITNDMLTRDPDVVREFEHDALRHNRISSGAFLGMMEAFEFIIPRASDVKLPTLMAISDTDPVVSTSKAVEFFENMGSKKKELKLYPGAKHEIVNDIIRKDVFQDFKKYLDQILESK